MFGLPRIHHRPRNVRLDTLVRLRWLAVFGQFAAVLVVHFGLEFDVPIWPCLAGDRAGGAAQHGAARRFPPDAMARARPRRLSARLRHRRARGAALPHRRPGESVFLFAARPGADFGDRAAAAHDAADRHFRRAVRDRADLLPLPAAVGQRGAAGASRDLRRRRSGSRSCSRSAISASTRGRSPRKRGSFRTPWRRPSWCWRASSISRSSTVSPRRRRTNLARRSPPSRVVVREIERALEANSPYAEDVKLLREQAQRCREILSKITELPAGEPFDRVPLSALIEEAVAPHRHFGVSIGVTLPPDRYGRAGRRPQSGDPLRPRQSDRERGRFRQQARGDRRAMDARTRCASPSATTARALRRKSWTASARPTSPIGGPDPREPGGDEDEAVFGLGLGFFIAKTLLERSGAKLSLKNQVASAAWRRGHRRLEPRRFRAAAGCGTLLSGWPPSLNY